MTADELKQAIGREAVSDWIVVSQTMIDAFADATGDRQFIHVEPARAADTPFGGTVAHGFLTLSLLPQIAARTPGGFALDAARMAVNYGGNRVRFVTPVPSGARVRGRQRLVAVEAPRGDQLRVTVETTVEIEDRPTPAMVAEWIVQYFL